ncbi:Crp/Fnr family transcriptional regulator [Undibacterium piscinae]|uniref:Crp/Fnr family transcriptional regulator n=1 Tax=Undibacterium piscinae TaxID=2495591 RepID=A0A6M4A5Z4_9BURK|nr:Crp/Fnr family transcriptional regulator [Undibacterium piscinae]
MKQYLSDKPARDLLPGEALSVADLQAIWRLESGAMRIDSVETDGASSFVRLVLPGDVLGMESLAGVEDTLLVRALVPVSLVPVSALDAQHLTRLLMDAVQTAHYRCREVVRLRSGPVDQRVKRLLQMLAYADAAGLGPAMACAMPSLGNMAEIVNATRETVCRVLANLRENHFLEDCNTQSPKRKLLEHREHRVCPGPASARF